METKRLSYSLLVRIFFYCISKIVSPMYSISWEREKKKSLFDVKQAMFTCVVWQLPGLYCHMLGSKDLYHERLHAMRVVMGFMLDVLIGELLTEYIFKLEGATKHIKHIEWQNIWFTYGSQWTNLISCDFEKNTFENYTNFWTFISFVLPVPDGIKLLQQVYVDWVGSAIVDQVTWF